MPLRLAYLGLTNASRCCDSDKDTEVMVLRHQLAVLQHQRHSIDDAPIGRGLQSSDDVPIGRWPECARQLPGGGAAHLFAERADTFLDFSVN
ncbi:hypothetical protein [Actinoplanes sp. NPDC026670]|uniref:hypothetical protein n=1 Tax=Actinoplanes sp. NPDC026670 TaxID=3154700 RepID=UPI0033DA813A